VDWANIGDCIGCTEQRPYDTVEPLAKSLGLTVNQDCGRDDPQCVAKLISNYKGGNDIVVCWEHAAMSNIPAAVGWSGTTPCIPSDR
jgi:hypothetical protein